MVGYRDRRQLSASHTLCAVGVHNLRTLATLIARRADSPLRIFLGVDFPLTFQISFDAISIWSYNGSSEKVIHLNSKLG